MGHNRRFFMDDSRKDTTGDRSTQIAMTMGLLLFASIILGSGALGDDRDSNAAGEDRVDDSDDRVGDDVRLTPEMCRERGLGWDEDTQECLSMENGWDGEFAHEDMDDRDRRGMDERRGDDDRDRGSENQMRVPPEVLREMAGMWCHNHVFNTFWENTHAVELDDGSGFEIITYDDDGHEESTVISHDAMWQITSGLEPLVGSCAAMMMELMGVGMQPHDHEDDWDEMRSLEEYCEEHPDDEDCHWEDDEDDSDTDWNESDESGEDESQD